MLFSRLILDTSNDTTVPLRPVSTLCMDTMSVNPHESQSGTFGTDLEIVVKFNYAIENTWRT